MASFVSNLGLNLQKLNHLRNDRATAASSSASSSHNPAAPLPPFTSLPHSSHADVAASLSRQSVRPASLHAASRTYPSYQSTGELPAQPLPSPHSASSSTASPVVSSSPPLSRTPSPPPSPVSYHRQSLWRVGLSLVIVGSLADFVALIFAAQSIIAPLGSLTLVFNTMLAPLLLGEHVAAVDVLATVAIVLGSSLSVACADHRDRLYGLGELFGLFLQPRFVCYSLVILAVISLLYYHIRHLTAASHHTASTRKHIRLCYASLAGIVGAQSVLFAKCVGTMVVDSLTGRSLLFVHIESWVIVALLGLSVTLQIHYLNEGLRLFTASFIIPVYQSFWVITSVLSGMVFFGEYKGVMDEWSSAVGFPVGVMIVVAGVYVLSQRGGADEDEGGLEGDDEDGEAGEGEQLSVDGGEGEKAHMKRREQAEDERRAQAAARLLRLTAAMPYQPPIAASQSHHIAFPSASSSSFFLQVPYPPRSMRRALTNGRSRTELQTAPIVSSPVMYTQLSSSSPEASYVPPPADGESKVREQLYD